MGKALVVTLLSLFAFEGLGQSNLLDTLKREPRIVRGGGRRLPLVHNSYETVAREIQEPAFRKLLGKVLRLPDESLLRHPYAIDEAFHIEVGLKGLSRTNANSLASLLHEYVLDRTSGHTEAYALASLRQRCESEEAETDGFRLSPFEQFPHLPRAWVKEDPFQSPTPTATNAAFSKRFVIIDGEIAWSYSVPLGRAPIVPLRIDGQEFDPKLKPKFEAATQEAVQSLANRGLTTNHPAYHRSLQSERSAILREKYGINHRNTIELNPGLNH